MEIEAAFSDLVISGPKITDSIDILTLITSYLNRKKKWSIRAISKDFYLLVVPQSLISLRFYLNRTLESDYFAQTLSRCKRVNKLVLDDIKIPNQ